MDRVSKILWTASALGWLTAATGILGELLDWWDAVGEVLSVIGVLAGLIIACFGLAWSVSRSQVGAVATGVAAATVKLDGIDHKLGQLDKLDALDEHTVLLREIRDRL